MAKQTVRSAQRNKEHDVLQTQVNRLSEEFSAREAEKRRLRVTFYRREVEASIVGTVLPVTFGVSLMAVGYWSIDNYYVANGYFVGFVAAGLVFIAIGLVWMYIDTNLL